MSRGRFSPDQVERLLRPIKQSRVYTSQGQSHVAGWEIAAHLTRMFGFGGWEKEILELTCVAEEHAPEWNDKKNWFVTYRCHLRLRVYDAGGFLAVQIDDVGTGTSPNLPGRGDAHDFAAKNAVTYALKRCAKDLGDQFGLSLYDKGRRGAVVGMTLVGAAEVSDEPDVKVEGEGDDHEPPVADEPDERPAAPAGVDEETGEVAAVDVVPASVAKEWLDRMAIEPEAERVALKNRFGNSWGPPSTVPTTKAKAVDAWLDTELAAPYEAPAPPDEEPPF